jgi:hypothetical protein
MKHRLTRVLITGLCLLVFQFAKAQFLMDMIDTTKNMGKEFLFAWVYE